MEYDSENWELKIEIRQADIIPQDEDKDKCRMYPLFVILINRIPYFFRID